MDKIQENKKTSKSSRWLFPIAFVSWLYIFVNSFILSVDAFIAINYPAIAQYLYFKYIAIAIFLLYLFGFYKGWRLIGILLYLMLFPLIFIFWHIPSIIFSTNQVNILFAYIISVASYIFSFRRKIIDVALVTIGFTLCCSSVKIFNVIGILMITYFLFRHIRYRILHNSNPIAIISSDTEGLFNLIEKPMSFEIDFNQGNEIEDSKKQSHIQNAVLYFGAMKYVEKSAKRFKDTRASFLFSLYQSGVSFLIVIFCFSLINYSLFSLSPNEFKTEGNINLFTFLYYTTFNGGYGGVSQIDANGYYSQALRISQIVLVVSLLLPIVGLLLGSVSNKRDNDLQRISDLAVKRNQDIDIHMQSVLAKSLKDLKEELYSKGDAIGLVATYLEGGTKLTIQEVFRLATEAQAKNNAEKKINDSQIIDEIKDSQNKA